MMICEIHYFKRKLMSSQGAALTPHIVFDHTISVCVGAVTRANPNQKEYTFENWSEKNIIFT